MLIPEIRRNALKYLNHLRENRISGYTPYTESNLPVVDPTALIQVDAEGKLDSIDVFNIE